MSRSVQLRTRSYLTPRGRNHFARTFARPFPPAVCLIVRSTQMMPPAKSRSTKLRVLCAALFLLIASASGPIALAVQIEDSCGMTCCVKEGRCCCSPRHSSVKGRGSNAGSSIAEAELTQSCPNGCATGLWTSKTLLRDYLRTAAQQAFDDRPLTLFHNGTKAAHDFVQSGSYAPRAPPIPSSN